MNVNKFVLLGGGNSGIVAECTEVIPYNNLSIIDKVKRTRPFMVPTELIETIGKLKYFYLNLTRHWMPPFNKYLDMSDYSVKSIPDGEDVPQSYMMMQGLLSNTEIIGVSVSNAGFCIMGKIEVVPGKKSAITTPLVTEEDDVSFFMEAMERIMKIMDAVSGLLTSGSTVQIDVERAARILKLEDKIKETLNRDKLLEVVIDEFNKRGLITIAGGPDVELAPESIGDGEPRHTLYTGTGSIDSHNMPEAEHVDEESDEDEENEGEDIFEVIDTNNDIVVVIDKKPIGKGTLASEKGFPILDDISAGAVTKTDDNIPAGGTLEDYEYSEHLGIPREDVNESSTDFAQSDVSDDDMMDQTPKEW